MEGIFHARSYAYAQLHKPRDTEQDVIGNFAEQRIFAQVYIDYFNRFR